MRLRILSDLHIEFFPFTIPALPGDQETVLILAGDIGVIYQQDRLQTFLEAACQQFKAVIYVLGNHEYYRGQWPNARTTLLQWPLPQNLHVLERNVVTVDGVAFVGSTLWSDFDAGDPLSMHTAQHQLSDFHYIRVALAPGNNHPEALADSPQERQLNPSDILADHSQSVAWLDKTLGQLHRDGQKTVLVTHHGFSRRSIHEDFKDSQVNGAFVSACDFLLEKHQPVLAVHGHVHNGFDYRIGQTRVIVNPRGYTQREDTQENPVFDPCLTIEL